MTTAPQSVLPAVGFDEFRRQELALIRLNLAILALVALIHLAFRSLLGSPTWILVLALALRIVEQSAEFTWLNDPRAMLGERATRFYAAASVWIHLAVAFGISLMGKMEDTHLRVLMILPMIAAGFRFRLPGLMAVVASGSVLSFAEVYIHYGNLPENAATESFEAATTCIIYLAVGLVVRSMANQLQRDQASLRQSLEELHRTRDRLVEEEKLAALGRLAAAIAHEIRNPVAMLVSAAGLARKREYAPDTVHEMCGIIQQETARLEALTSDFLSYARAKPLQPASVPLDDFLGYTLSLAVPRAEPRQINLEVAPAPIESAVFDQHQLVQAVVNLLLNACDASAPGSTVRLGAELRGDRLVLRVCNSGPAIPAEEAAHLFEPFYTTKPDGTGLGLAITDKIARAHGGEVALAVNTPADVCFEIRLPLSTP